jgi:hypothetical protein
MEGFESDSGKSVVFGHILYCKINEQINYLYTRLNFVRLIGGQASMKSMAIHVLMMQLQCLPAMLSKCRKVQKAPVLIKMQPVGQRY